jgi:hypothetical protein
MRLRQRRLVAISAAIVMLVAVGHATSIAVAQSHSPEELWNAYPLQPGSARSEPADPAPTPTAAATRAAAGPAADGAAEGKSSVTTAILIGFATLAFCVGFAMVAFRVQGRRAEVLEPPWPLPAEPPARRFEPSQTWPGTSERGVRSDQLDAD